MRGLMVSLSMLALVACGPRQVEVRTGPEPVADVALHVTNNLSQSVNVYVVNQGNDLFLKQVAANSTEDIPVAGVTSGTQVRLKATRTDGSKTYTSDPMPMNATTTWRVP